MKNRLLAGVTALCLLALAIVATIYMAWLVYPLEIKALHLTQLVDLTEHQIASNFNQLLAYLTNPFVSKLTMSDFPSSTAGLKHFADVKRLFLLAQAILLLTFVPALRFLRQRLRDGSFFLYQRFFGTMAALPILLGLLAVLIGFDQFFTLFHQVLFPGDSTWLFDPLTDPVIYILPEDFFLHCFLIFFAFYQVFFWGCYVLARKQYKQYLIKQK